MVHSCFTCRAERFPPSYISLDESKVTNLQLCVTKKSPNCPSRKRNIYCYSLVSFKSSTSIYYHQLWSNLPTAINLLIKEPVIQTKLNENIGSSMVCGYTGIFFYILETLAIDMSYLQLYVNKATHMPNVVPIYSI